MNRWLLIAALLAPALCWAQDASRYHRITVVDQDTGRGVPLVELKTVNSVIHMTDSAGVAAIHEPGLMGQRVFFHVRSHGYAFPEDGFKVRGTRVELTPNGSTTLKLKRVNVAERLYRVTGQGIYRDSVLLGDAPPIPQPLLNGGVLGQDSVQNAVYKDRLLWIWGDTSRASYPLGNFAASGATSKLPGKGGLDPSKGVDLKYWVDAEGFSRKMCPLKGPGPVWLGGLMVFEHEGRPRLACYYMRVKELGVFHEHGIALWNDAAERFEKVKAFPLDVRLHPNGHPIRVTEGGEDWFVFPDPYPTARVRARWDDILDPGAYEAYTCLVDGAPLSKTDPALDRDEETGELRWAWRADTGRVTAAEWKTWQDKGLVKKEESYHRLHDVQTGKPVLAHGGSVYRNAHRKRWVMIFLQSWGSSMVGEVWYAEAPKLMGPWEKARKIVTHDRYSFYNVKHHPYFDQDGGRRIYFEGTYTAAFSGNEHKTPRYDYNQIMYRLDLDDPRLKAVR